MFCPNTKRRKPPCLPEVLLFNWYFNQLRWGWRHLLLRLFGKTYLFIGNYSLSIMLTKEKLKCFTMAIKLDLWHSPCGDTVFGGVDCTGASGAADCTLMADKVLCCFLKLRRRYSVGFIREKVTVLCVIQTYEHKNKQLYIFKCTVILFENAFST